MSDPRQPPPAFRLEKMYLKDLSFENPNAPQVFLQQQQPKAEVNFSLQNRKIDGERWEVTLVLSATVRSDDKVVFILEVEHAGVFHLQNIPEERVPAVLAVDGPTLLFPFTRQIVSQAVVDGGFVPFLLEPVNFSALFQNSQKAAATPGPH